MLKQDHWLACQLPRLAKSDPDAYGAFLVRLQQTQPDIFAQLALMAIEHGDLTPAECAGHLDTDLAGVEMQLQVYRLAVAESDRESLVERDEHGIARLSQTQIAVWEVVREHRRLGSVEALKANYTALTESELFAAIGFGERHLEEVEARITAYEESRTRARQSYPGN